MRLRWSLAAIAALALAACGQPAQQPSDQGSTPSIEDNGGAVDAEAVLEALPEVDQPMRDAPAADFVALEPSELGVFGAPTIAEALDPLIGSPEAHQEGASVSVSIRESSETAVADVVRANIPDDSVAAGHVRVEFRREPEGWFPTNAYRRSQCRRGELAGQWTSGLCP